MASNRDPEGRRLPIKLDSTSNGEFAPVPLDPVNRRANRIAQEWGSEFAKRRGVPRRSFMVSACGAASTLLAFNAANAAAGRVGGHFEVDEVAALDPEAAAERLDGREFVFDVQGHFVGENGRNRGLGGADQFMQDVFLDSDTDMMVLSFIPSERERELLRIEEADEVRRIIDRMEGTKRLLLHGRANPNQDGDTEGMDELAERWGVVAWKCYSQWGPDGRPGFFLHDDAGLRMIEKARALGVKNICVHKGLPFGRRSYEHSLASDIGTVARMFPDVNFLVYHSGFISDQPEGPYDPARGEGVDELIRSVEENEVPRNSNVYAELGSTWRFAMRNPTMAAHIVGKLVKHVGESNVLYGSDCIWYGSPQDQIQGLRTFQISEELQERHGYPKMTAQLRAQILGLNGARVYGVDVDEVLLRARNDHVARRRYAYRESPDPHFLTHGPTNRREFLALRRARGGAP